MNDERTFRIAFWGLVGAVILMRVFFLARVRRAGGNVLPDREAVRREGRGFFTLRLALFLFLLTLLVYGISPLHLGFLGIPLPAPVRWAGVGLGAVSVGFWTWTHLALGRFWSAQLQLQTDHHLVTTGPYARIRHPMYTAIMGWMIGAALVTANWALVAFAAAMIIFLAGRVPNEEQMLVEHFGDEYREYTKRSGRFLPR